MSQKQCPFCNVEMTPGRRRDKGDSFTIDEEKWVSGDPQERGWFSGHGQAHPVTTYACPRCGLLQSYVSPSAARSRG